MRNAFYRDNYYRVLFAVLFLIAINLGLGIFVYHKWANPPLPQYFATTASGVLIKIHPLSDPTVPDDFVLQWTSDAIRKSFNLDYIHWREQLQSASENYTPDGWTYFSNALKSTNNLKTLVNLKMVSDAKITGAPQIIRKAVVGGSFSWNIKIPLMVVYSNGAKTINQPIEMTVIVMREPVQYYPDKIAINNVFSATVNPNAYSGN